LKAALFILILSVLLYTEIQAQSLTLIKEVKINTPVAVSIDRYGNIYTGDTQGNIFKFDSTGIQLGVFSAQKTVNISSIEAWQMLQVFVFYRDIQEFTLLNRFLTPIAGSTQVNQNLIGFARSATLAANETLWMFDDTEFSLKKYGLSSQQVLINTPLSLILGASDYNINFMREYQNMLYINDKNSGILVFDNLGNYKKKLPFVGLNYFSFRGNELYFIEAGKVHLFNLYTLDQRNIVLPAEYTYIFALLAENKLITFTKNAFQIYWLPIR
jgi:hypothetical protein